MFAWNIFLFYFLVNIVKCLFFICTEYRNRLFFLQGNTVLRLLTCFVYFNGMILGPNIFFSLSSSHRIPMLSKRKFNNKHISI